MQKAQQVWIEPQTSGVVPVPYWEPRGSHDGHKQAILGSEASAAYECGRRDHSPLRRLRHGKQCAL